MAIREKPIYISNEVGRWLWLLSKAETIWEQSDQGHITTDRRITPDLIADQILRQAIREQYPQLSEHEKEITKLEKQLIETLRNHENETIPRVSDKSD